MPQTFRNSLFPEIPVVPQRKTKDATFNDYDGFVEKFKPKKTTDDCYTPPSSTILFMSGSIIIY